MTKNQKSHYTIGALTGAAVIVGSFILSGLGQLAGL